MSCAALKPETPPPKTTTLCCTSLFYDSMPSGATARPACAQIRFTGIPAIRLCHRAEMRRHAPRRSAMSPESEAQSSLSFLLERTFQRRLRQHFFPGLQTTVTVKSQRSRNFKRSATAALELFPAGPGDLVVPGTAIVL